MPNDIYQQAQRQLATMISGRAARRVLDRSLKAAGHSRDAVTSRQMRDTLLGPVLTELASILPGPGLKHHLREVSRSLKEHSTAAATPTPPPSEPVAAAQLIDTSSGNGKQTLSSFPMVEAIEEPPTATEMSPRDSSATAEAVTDIVPGHDSTPAATTTIARHEAIDPQSAPFEPPRDPALSADSDMHLAGSTATATLPDPVAHAQPIPAGDSGRAEPLPEERLKELALHFAQVDDVRQIAAIRANGELVEVRGSAVDLAALSSLGPSSMRLFEQHGPIRSYYLQHPQGQLLLFPLRGDLIAVVGNSKLNLGTVFTALAALEEEL